MNFAEQCLQFAERVGQVIKGLNHRVDGLESRVDQDIESLSIQVQSVFLRDTFPTLPADQLNLIARSLRYADQHSALSTSDILDLLRRPGNVIWDLQHKWGLFQDAAGLSPVTGDNQSVRLVKPWIGSNNLVLDEAFSPLTSNQSEGALFPQSNAVGRFNRRTDLKFLMSAVTPDLSNTGDLVGPMLLGDIYFYNLLASEVGGYLFSATYASVAAEGEIWRDGVKTTNNASWPSTPSLITLKPVSEICANSIADDRGLVSSYRNFYGRARLYLISSEVFTATEIEALNQFGLHYSGLVA